MQDVGLSFRNRRNKMQDSFRARVMFPIFSESGEALAFGGRILPGSDDPAKYKNSSETPIYTKSKTLYGLNWAKADVAKHDQVIVCEGYTDVIGFHRAGVPRAVATCGTALTEEHVRLLKRYASRVVLAFDADAAGQGAAERFYEWEQKHKVEVLGGTAAGGQGSRRSRPDRPGRAARRGRRLAAVPRFRLQRTLNSRPIDSPEHRARLAEEAMAVVNEHPNANVRKLYAGEVAARVGLPVNDLVGSPSGGRAARRSRSRPSAPGPDGERRVRGARAARAGVGLDRVVAGRGVVRRRRQPLAFLALAEADGDLQRALESVPPDAGRCSSGPRSPISLWTPMSRRGR